jgi:hypothetical protein
MVVRIYRTEKRRKLLSLFLTAAPTSIVLYRKHDHERSGRHCCKCDDKSSHKCAHSGAIVTDFLGCFSGFVQIGGYFNAT